VPDQSVEKEEGDTHNRLHDTSVLEHQQAHSTRTGLNCSANQNNGDVKHSNLPKGRERKEEAEANKNMHRPNIGKDRTPDEFQIFIKSSLLNIIIVEQISRIYMKISRPRSIFGRRQDGSLKNLQRS
jgi:hypothetical protein